MHTKVMRSASSEDMRSEARRAIRTREGKDRFETTIPSSVQALVAKPISADHGSLVQVGIDLRVDFRRPSNGSANVAVTTTTSNDSDRDSLPDNIEKHLGDFLAELPRP